MNEIEQLKLEYNENERLLKKWIEELASTKSEENYIECVINQEGRCQFGHYRNGAKSLSSNIKATRFRQNLIINKLKEIELNETDTY
jgi:hypothetical protein